MLDEVERILNERGALIQKEIEKAIPRAGIQNLHDAVWYHLDTGGKRIRPVLALLTCETLKGDVEKATSFAAACEILHNWLLVHDDIEDGDKVRRDKPAVWVKYGLGHGINIGDFMSEKVYELVTKSDLGEKTKIDLINEIVETCVKTAEGQTMDMNLRDNNNPKEADYMKMIGFKTAWYLTLPMVGGAVIAGRPELTDKIKQFGMKIGPAFQIVDDLLDLTKGKGRGEIGSDIKEGKRSIMVVHCISKCTEDEKDTLFEILNRPRENTSPADIQVVKALFEKYDSIDYAEKKARALVKESKAVTAKMPKELQHILDQFADYMVERKK